MGLGDLEYVTQRLLRNPDDFAVVLRQFYGDEIAMEFEELFTHHLLIAADLLNAVMAGNQSDSAEIRSIWYENAEDLATFLSEVNPFWNKDTWQNMLFDHLEMIEEEVSLLLNEHYADSITQYDAIQNQAIEMAYEMAFGIFQQLGK